MSLLPELLRQLLDYLGVPAEQLVSAWERFIRRRSLVRALANRLPPVLLDGIDIQRLYVLERKNYGWTRSVVRIIGTLLPLERCPRPRIQEVLEPGIVKVEEYETVKRPKIASLADAPYLLDDSVMTCTRYRHDHLAKKSVGEFVLAGPRNTDSGFVTVMSGHRLSENNLPPANDCAIQKIAALEDELMRLRVQIAAIVAMQESKGRMQPHTESLCLFGSPSTVLPPPCLASTPLTAQFLQCTTPVAPPPPPAPPTHLTSAIALIRERKASRKLSPSEGHVLKKGNGDKIPDMMEVLKGINSIKLRAIERSPGGTPLTRKDKKRRSINDATDPAAIIARALKQKFVHRYNDDSTDKENRSYEESPFSSPETPMFGRHLLKPAEKRRKRETTRKSVHV